MLSLLSEIPVPLETTAFQGLNACCINANIDIEKAGRNPAKKKRR